MALVVQKRDALGKAVLAQRGGDLKAGMAGAHDQNRSLHNRSLRHRDNPISGAQESPMSSPLTADVGLLAFVRAALVSASRTMGALLGLKVWDRARVSCPKTGQEHSAPIRPGIVTSSRLLFKYLSSVPIGGLRCRHKIPPLPRPMSRRGSRSKDQLQPSPSTAPRRSTRSTCRSPKSWTSSAPKSRPMTR